MTRSRLVGPRERAVTIPSTRRNGDIKKKKPATSARRLCGDRFPVPPRDRSRRRNDDRTLRGDVCAPPPPPRSPPDAARGPGGPARLSRLSSRTCSPRLSFARRQGPGHRRGHRRNSRLARYLSNQTAQHDARTTSNTRCARGSRSLTLSSTVCEEPDGRARRWRRLHTLGTHPRWQ